MAPSLLVSTFRKFDFAFGGSSLRTSLPSSLRSQSLNNASGVRSCAEAKNAPAANNAIEKI